MRRRRWIRPFLARNGSPEAIARGLAVGLFVAFSPTMGFQILLAYLLATLLKASRAAALIPIWITTPLTLVPIYLFTYTVGAWMVPGPSAGFVRKQLVQLVRRLDRHAIYDFPAQVREVLSLSREIILPMLVGGAVVGALCAAVAYPLSWALLRRFHRRRAEARLLRRGRSTLATMARRMRQQVASHRRHGV